MANELESWRAEQQRKFEKDRTAYLSLSPKMVALHYGEYVGIVDGAIIGFDKDEKTLEAKIEQQFGANVDMYLKKVGEEDIELKTRSPRIK